MELSNYKLPKVEKPKPGEPRSKREELLDKFLLKINECRKAGGFTEISIGRLVRMLAGYKPDQLQFLYDDCTAPGIPFSALFFTKMNKRTYSQRPRLPDPDPL